MVVWNEQPAKVFVLFISGDTALNEGGRVLAQRDNPDRPLVESCWIVGRHHRSRQVKAEGLAPQFSRPPIAFDLHALPLLE